MLRKHILRMHKIKQSGFSLIEILIFVTVLSIFFITAASVVTFSIKNMQASEKKIFATRYAEEVISWLASERDIDWNEFTERTSTSGTNYCFIDLAWSEPSETCPIALDNTYSRSVRLTSFETAEGFEYQVNAEATVRWMDAEKNQEVAISTVFTIWEQ